VIKVLLILLCAAGGAFYWTKSTEGPALQSGAKPAAPSGWPPVLGAPYPDLELIDQTGARVRLSSFRGRVIVVEPIGMSCPACQAFSGAHRVGAFGGVVPQRDLRSFEEYVSAGGGGPLFRNESVVFVQLLLFDLAMGVPTAADAAKWAAHFGFRRERHQLVLAGSAALQGKAGYDMVPGFQLVDRDFKLVVDSTGHRPRQDLYRDLIPSLARMLRR
jgi:hypothetical protein